MTRLEVLLIGCLAIPALARAQTAPPAPPSQPAPAAVQTTAPEYPAVRIGMVSYLQYDDEIENQGGLNAFDVTRAYVNINAQVSRNVRFRFTPDVRRVTDGSLNGTLTVRVKYAFAEFDDTTHGAWLRVGMHQTPWLDFEESINRYRVQGTMFAERDGLIPGSADFGVSYFRPLPHGFGEFHVGVYNGEGYAHAESNKYKSVEGRLTVRPLPARGLAKGLRLSGFYNAGWYDHDQPRRLGILMASFEHPHLVATVQHLAATEHPLPTATDDTDRSGSSAFLEVRQGAQGWAGLARFDHFDPDRQRPGDAHDRTVAGGAYWFVWPRARVGVVTTLEYVAYGSAAAHAREGRLLAQTHVEF
ncbi:MAG: hypothetical protein AB7O28_15550 [Vicinamibacterales bacterium]